MSYIERILCFVHVVYFYTGVRKTNKVLCFLVDHEPFSDIFQLGFTPCKAEHPLQGMELQEKEAQKD